MYSGQVFRLARRSSRRRGDDFRPWVFPLSLMVYSASVIENTTGRAVSPTRPAEAFVVSRTIKVSSAA